MEHIRKYHIQKQSMKSTFVAGLDVKQLIHDVLTHPLVKLNQTNGGTWASFQK